MSRQPPWTRPQRLVRRLAMTVRLRDRAVSAWPTAVSPPAHEVAEHLAQILVKPGLRDPAAAVVYAFG
ncbi:hypothetical protein ACGFR8_23510 [Streptomyces brevispora]|uniref:hypothetical protein n=1 Tax=Streptomyces brevispora TaxID=887462 RepID=UPI00371854B2